MQPSTRVAEKASSGILKRDKSKKPSRRLFGLETLEERQVLANNPLMITEIMYHPPLSPTTAAFAKEDEYEYIEFFNAGDTTLTLGPSTNVTVTQPAGGTTRVQFLFPANYVMQPGSYALAVKNSNAFTTRYGAAAAAKIAGVYTANPQFPDNYDTGAARVILASPVNEDTSIRFQMDDGSALDFPKRPDGDGASLEIRVPAATITEEDYNDPGNWQSSDEYQGSPGRPGINEHDKHIRINEILANSPVGDVDKIELINTSAEAVDISGWVLTDNSQNNTSNLLGWFQIPNGTILRGGQYITFTESQFNPVGGQNAFGLSSKGNDLFLLTKQADGTRLFEDVIHFDATKTSQSIGRAPNATGSFLPLVTPTFGSANSSPELSPIIISEVMYDHPAASDDNLKYIELYNTTNAAIPLSVTQGTTGNHWELTQGVGYTFANAPAIPAHGTVLVVGFDPNQSPALKTTFLNTYGPYGIPPNATILGPWTGNLAGGGERVNLSQPFQDTGTIYSIVLADTADIDNNSPWPQGPDGGIGGIPYAVQRTSTSNNGNLPDSWRGAVATPGVLSLPPTASPLEGLVVTEVMYDPLELDTDENGDPLPVNHLEYIELVNTTGTTKSLANAGIGQGVQYKFPAGTTIGAGERIIVVPFDLTSAADEAKRNEFFARYGIVSGEVTMFGPWTGTLSNSGDSIGLFDSSGNTFLEFEYNNRGGWPDRAAGKGSSLELVDQNAVPTGAVASAAYLNDPTHWQASTAFQGTPGEASNTTPPQIIINEVNTHTDPPFSDAVELYNAGPTPVNLQDWVLTDEIDDPTTWFFLPNKILPPGQYITFDSEANGWNHKFSLNASEGETVYLLRADEFGLLQSFEQEAVIPATFSDISLGRWPNGTNTEFFPMVSRTLSQYNTPTLPGNVYSDGANSGPKFDDIVISEVMYNPGGVNPNDFEYIELFNRVGSPLNLGPLEDDTGWPGKAEGWRIRGSSDFDFTSAHTIPASGTLLVVGFDPVLEPAKLTAFKTRYGISGNSTPIVGPFIGFVPLPDDGGRIELENPDTAQTILPTNEKFTPNVLVDRVLYDDAAPWPTSPDGTGQSLQRNHATDYGDFGASWTGAAPNPGSYTTSTPTGAAKVTNVIVSGSTWNAAFKSNISTSGSAVQGYTIPKGATQTTVIPWQGINQVSITFDRAVTVGTSALAVRGVTTPTYTVSAAATYDPVSFTATWTLSTPITGDKLILDLDDAKVTSSGNALDGEWTDGQTGATSGNGTAGGDFRMRIHVLPGDLDRDGDVQADDFQAIRNQTVYFKDGGALESFADVDGSGSINYLDLIFARNQTGKTLPAGTPSSPEAPASVVARSSGTRTLTAVRTSLSATATRNLRAAAVDEALAPVSGEELTGLSALRARRTARASGAAST